MSGRPLWPDRVGLKSFGRKGVESRDPFLRIFQGSLSPNSCYPSLDPRQEGKICRDPGTRRGTRRTTPWTRSGPTTSPGSRLSGPTVTTTSRTSPTPSRVTYPSTRTHIRHGPPVEVVRTQEGTTHVLSLSFSKMTLLGLNDTKTIFPKSSVRTRYRGIEVTREPLNSSTAVCG